MSSAGGCLCGAVRFTVERVDPHFHACHCGMCRRWTGGPFLAAETHGVVFEGEENIVRYKSSDWAERGFCRTCGSTLFYFMIPSKGYAMSVGAFDEQSTFRLAREIFIDAKPDGFAFSGDQERWTEAKVLEEFEKAGGSLT